VSQINQCHLEDGDPSTARTLTHRGRVRGSLFRPLVISKCRNTGATWIILTTGASPFSAKPEMGSVRFQMHKMRRRPWPSAAHVRPASVPAHTPRGTRTPTRTGRRVAWP